MVLESTVVCIDNSDYMRNGDFIPSRLHAQQDAVNLICHSKSRANPENNLGLISIASTTNVLVTLTTDVNKVIAKLHQVQPKGKISFVSSIRIAHLVLKHRQGKNHKMRIIVFIGSPIAEDDKEVIKLAKKLRKEKVNVDVINFGEEALNTEKLNAFVDTINGTDGTGSHLVTVAAGPHLSEALISSPIIVGEDGTGAMSSGYDEFGFGIDPNEDPELALALRVSMEEQRARQEDESRKAITASAADSGKTTEISLEDQLLQQAMEMSMQTGGSGGTTETLGKAGGAEVTAMDTSSADAAHKQDVTMMSEDDQMALALQMSMQAEMVAMATAAMETSDASSSRAGTAAREPMEEEEDYSDVMNDPEFLQSVLQDLPGVNPHDSSVKEAVMKLTTASAEDRKKKEEKKKEQEEKKKDGGGKKE